MEFVLPILVVAEPVALITPKRGQINFGPAFPPRLNPPNCLYSNIIPHYTVFRAADHVQVDSLKLTMLGRSKTPRPRPDRLFATLQPISTITRKECGN